MEFTDEELDYNKIKNGLYKKETFDKQMLLVDVFENIINEIKQEENL